LILKSIDLEKTPTLFIFNPGKIILKNFKERKKNKGKESSVIKPNHFFLYFKVG
jgi:hypothetical protein